MATTTDADRRRPPLTRRLVLETAVALADQGGVEVLSMRRLAVELGVVPMALYKHVAHKDELLGAMVETVMEQVNDAAARTEAGTGAPARAWRPALRQRVLAARQVFLRHPWAPALLTSRTTMTPSVVRYFDSVIGLLRGGGFSVDLTHHAMHALGSRVLGFTQELYDDSGDVDADTMATFGRMAADFPHITEMIATIVHDADSTLGWCDDQVEFEFALDLLLDGLESLLARSLRDARSS